MPQFAGVGGRRGRAGGRSPGRSIGWVDAAEADPRAAELGQARGDPARVPGRARPRAGPGGAERRRRLLLRARALRRRRRARRLGDDLRRPLPHRRHRRRRAARAPSSPPRSGCGWSRWRPPSGCRGSGRCGAPPRGPASPPPASGCSASCRRPGSSRRRSRRAPPTLEGSAYLADVATLYAAYAAARDRLGRIDSHAIARAAIAALRDDPAFWRDARSSSTGSTTSPRTSSTWSSPSPRPPR